MRGGSTSPASSECVITSAPISLVLTPWGGESRGQNTNDLVLHTTAEGLVLTGCCTRTKRQRTKNTLDLSTDDDDDNDDDDDSLPHEVAHTSSRRPSVFWKNTSNARAKF
jgi:hypothetical protein